MLPERKESFHALANDLGHLLEAAHREILASRRCGVCTVIYVAQVFLRKGGGPQVRVGQSQLRELLGVGKVGSRVKG